MTGMMIKKEKCSVEGCNDSAFHSRAKLCQKHGSHHWRKAQKRLDLLEK